jgi:hypothetical protein
MCCRRRATQRNGRGMWLRARFAHLALGVLRIARSKRLWALTGHYLQYLKKRGILTVHRETLRRRWSVRGSKRNIDVNDEV